MPKDKTKPKTTSKRAGLSIDRQAIVDALPDNRWNISDAAISIGYSKAYAQRRLPAILKSDVAFCDAMERKRAKIEKQEIPRREKRLQDLDRIIENPNTADRDVISAVQVQGKMCGWLSETIRHETTERQQLLDEAGRAEAARLSFIALDTRCLPDISHARKQVSSIVRDTLAQGIINAASDGHDSGSSEDVQCGTNHVL